VHGRLVLNHACLWRASSSVNGVDLEQVRGL
jgi:hypothetical protein